MKTMKMKNLKSSVLAVITILVGFNASAQLPGLQYYRANDKSGLNQFETSKDENTTYEGVKVRIGGDFALQFQGLNQSNTPETLVELGSNFNLPTANLNVDVQLLDGVRMHLRTYLSSRHHPEAWIKGGHLQIDKLDFVSPGFLSGFMEYATIRIGLDEFNYGDTHFRRSDNARAIFNPFVGNYIMDAFSTEAFGELTLQNNGFLAVLGLTNGKLNQSVVVNPNTDNKLSFFGKLGYDKQLNEDFRFRLTGSWYINNGTSTGTWLYGGDRAGSRYYNVMHTLPTAPIGPANSDFDGRFNARFEKITAFQINPFVKFKGLEVFGVFEVAAGGNEYTQPADEEGSFTQIGIEGLYRFGMDEKFYVGGRYNQVTGKARESATDNLEISRINIGGGWFLSNNILVKVEYVQQDYTGNAWTGKFEGAQFNGIVAEAAISF